MNPFAGVAVFLICVLETSVSISSHSVSLWLGFPVFCMFHVRMATYKNVNLFAGVPKFLICVLKTLKYFHKQPFSFLFLTCMATYRNVNPFAGVPMFLIRVLETFKCFYLSNHPSKVIMNINRFGFNSLSIWSIHGNL